VVVANKTDNPTGDFMEEVLTSSPFPINRVMTDNGKEYKGKIERGYTGEKISSGKAF